MIDDRNKLWFYFKSLVGPAYIKENKIKYVKLTIKDLTKLIDDYEKTLTKVSKVTKVKKPIIRNLQKDKKTSSKVSKVDKVDKVAKPKVLKVIKDNSKLILWNYLNTLVSKDYLKREYISFKNSSVGSLVNLIDYLINEVALTNKYFNEIVNFTNILFNILKGYKNFNREDFPEEINFSNYNDVIDEIGRIIVDKYKSENKNKKFKNFNQLLKDILKRKRKDRFEGSIGDEFNVNDFEILRAANEEEKRLIEEETEKVINEFEDFINYPIDENTFEFKFNYFGLSRRIFEKIKFNDDFNLLIGEKKEYIEKGQKKYSRSFYTLSPTNYEDVRAIFDEDENVINRETFGSDQEISRMMQNIVNVIFVWKKKNKTRPNGGYFKYYSKLTNDIFDFSKYGIYRNHSETDNYMLNCLEIALINSKISISKNDLARIKTIITTRYIPKKDLEIIAEELKLHLSIKSLDKNGKSRVEHYGKEYKNEIQIGLLDEHYFIIEDTIFSSYSIINYFNICNEENPNEIINIKDNGKFKRDKRKIIDSFTLIKLLLENKETHLEQINLSNCGENTIYVKGIDYGDNLQYTDTDIRLSEIFPLKSPKIFNETKKINYLDDNDNKKTINKVVKGEYKICYFDTETYTDLDFHHPYMICSEDRDEDNSGIINKKCFTGEYCILNWLKSLEHNYICFAHNLRYDFQFVIRYLNNVTDIVATGQRIKSVCGEFYNNDTNKKIKLCFKDTHGLISVPLNKFSKMFKLDCKKEILPYGLFTSETVFKKNIDITKAKEFLNDDDYNEFVNNAKEWDLINSNGELDHLGYSQKYCEMDVIVLKKGYEIFRGWMKQVSKDLLKFELDIDLCVSIPQFANVLGKYYGCFKDTYELAMVPRDFIQRCVIGGRCMTRDNKRFAIDHDVNDFDGVSLYPSAMNRMTGFLKGKPKIWNKNIDLTKVSGYFLEINVTKVGKKLHFPLLTKKDKNGIRQFSNDLIGREIYVDKVGLEDLIKFQQIEFEIIRGYYYDEGHNNKVNEFIKYLFEERKIKKKQNNPIECVYKLIMNAFYGKTIMKPIAEDVKIFIGNKEKTDSHISFNFNRIKQIVEIKNGMNLIKYEKPINKHFSSPHIGVEVLSMSKRIMNEVMALAEDENIEIYYQDTDSMHIDQRLIFNETLNKYENGIEKLSRRFKEIYNRDIVGEDLGQFHSDFSLSGSKKDAEIVSISSVFLGKKSYCDLLKSVDKNDKPIYGHHIRMKGIPNAIMDKEIKKNNNDLISYYKYFLSEEGQKIGKSIECVEKCLFKSNQNFTTSNNVSFIRTLKFMGESY